MNKNLKSFILKFLLIIAAWSVVWLVSSGLAIILFAPIFSIPMFIIMILTTPLFNSKKWNTVPMIIWSFPISAAVMFSGMWILSCMLSHTTTYYMNVEIEKQGDVKICTSMVEFTSYGGLRVLDKSFRSSTRKGEAAYCDLGNGDNIVVTIAYPEYSKGHVTLYGLPWRAAGFKKGDRKNWPDFIEGQIELTGDFIPFIVSFSDIEDPYSIEMVEFPGVVDGVEKDYVIKRIWVEMTHDEYKSYDIRSHIPWIDLTDERGRKVYRDVFSQIGIKFMSNNPFVLPAR